MSNARKAKMARADLARLAADWDRARAIEALATTAAAAAPPAPGRRAHRALLTRRSTSGR